MAREIFPTDHLIHQMRERGVSWGEIVEIANNPETIYGDKNGRKGERIYQKGKLAIVINKRGYVETVLLREVEQWDNNDARNR